MTENNKVEKSKVTTSASNTNQGANRRPSGNRPPRRDNKRRGPRRDKDEYQEQVVAINRISKTTKGGRNMRFNAVVIVGDKKGKVGFGTGKATEVPAAIKKAIKNAKDNVMKLNLVKGDTIAHQITGKFGAGQVFLKQAPEGTGVIAGSTARAILELAGIRNIYSKVQGSTTPINVVRATFDGLKNLKSAEEMADLRDKPMEGL